MDVLWFILIGLCAGWLAGRITWRRGFGWAGNLIVGVLGAVVGGFLFGLLGLRSVSPLGSLVTATIGAVVLLVLIGSLVGRRR